VFAKRNNNDRTLFCLSVWKQHGPLLEELLRVGKKKPSHKGLPEIKECPLARERQVLFSYGFVLISIW